MNKLFSAVRKLFVILPFVFAFAVAPVVVDSAHAQTAVQGNTPWSSTNGKTLFGSGINMSSSIYKNARVIILIFAGIATLALGVLAFFGKFTWKWAISLMAGLFVLVFASQVINFFTGGTEADYFAKSDSSAQ